MRKLFSIGFLATLFLGLNACGGGDDAFQDPGTPAPVVGALTLTTSTPTLPTNGATSADLRAFVQDENNVALAGVTVNFTSDGGLLNVTQAVTDENGIATATIAASSADPSNQTITVTAVAGDVTQTLTLDSSGTRLSLQGGNSGSIGQTISYTARLIDSGDAGISGRDLTVTSSNGNTLSSGTLTTDSSGSATFTVTIDNTGNDTITVDGLGLTASQTIAVSADEFTVSVPAQDDTEVNLNTARSVTVHWATNGTAVVGGTVQFATTRGTLSAPSAATNGSGDATVTVQSSTAGAGTITATATGVTAQRSVEFVATTASAIDVQPGVFTLAPNEETILTATVRDAAGNLVKNKLVTFNVVDNTGGNLSVASAATNSQGRAQSTYTAGSTTSATDGVVVTASVIEGVTTITDDVNLTVARREVFISVGTGNSITEPTEAQYKIKYAVQITDSAGNGVANVPLVISIVSVDYFKGSRAWNGTSWRGYSGLFGPCADEDLNHNGVLDPLEDFNSSTRLEAGNIALVTPSNVTTDSTGSAIVDVIYPQDHAYWVDVMLEASASVEGTEVKRASHFLLPGLAADFTVETNSPPGEVSPFGTQACNFAN